MVEVNALPTIKQKCRGMHMVIKKTSLDIIYAHVEMKTLCITILLVRRLTVITLKPIKYLHISL
jgi:hypothetical protein